MNKVINSAYFKLFKQVARSLLYWLVEFRASGPAMEKLAIYLGQRWRRVRAVRWYVYHVAEALCSVKWRDTNRLVVLPGGSQLAIDLREVFFRDLYFYEGYEPQVTAVFRQLVQPGALVFDLGANLGYYTCIAASLVGPGGQVHAFEADGDTFERLRHSVQLNNFQAAIHLNQQAVSEVSNQTLALYTSPTPAGKGLGSLLQQHSWGHYDYKVAVTSVCLDDYISQHAVGRIDLLKIDIEGAEMLAFKGMQQVLSTNPPRLIISEVSSEGLYRPQQLFEFLSSFGYRAYLIEPGGLTLLVDKLDIFYGNVLFAQPEAAQLVRNIRY